MGSMRSGTCARFLAEASAHPDRWCAAGRSSTRRCRRVAFYGRYLTHVFVWLNTLSLDIRDSMCGFRVYPLAPVLELLGQHDGSARAWISMWRSSCAFTGAACSMRWLPTRVSYPLDGVSHFRMVWDNVLMVRLQLKLFVGMLVRLPLLLWRKVS